MTPKQELFSKRAELALQIEDITRKQGQEVSNTDVVKQGLVAEYNAMQSNLRASNKISYDLHQEMLTRQHNNGYKET
jgi:hypothetical protein